MIRQPIRASTRVALGITAFVVIGLSYSVLSYRQHQVNPQDTTVPTWEQFRAGWQRLARPDSSGKYWLYEDARASAVRLFSGVGAGVGAAFILGVAMGCFTPIAAFFLPPIAFLARIPPTAMLAVYFVLLKSPFQQYVALIAIGVFPILAQAIYHAVRNDVTEHAIDKAYTLGASHFEVVCEVVCRQILPRVLDSIRLQIGPALVFLIAAEWLLADVGFGYRLRLQSRLLNMNIVYTYLLLLGLAGFLIDWLLKCIRSWLCPWYGE